MSDKFSVREEEVTPDLAYKYLNEAVCNRTISEMTVTTYADDIKRGKWHRNGETVKFDTDGKLCDGQHRMWAVIRADKPATMLVVRGVHPEAITTIDKGRARKLSDELKIVRGVSNSNNLAAYVNHVAFILASTRVVIKSLDQFDRWYAICKEGVDWAVEVMTKARLCRESAVAGALAYAYKKDPAIVTDFGTRLRDGTGLTTGEPVWVLRQYLERRHLASHSTGASADIQIVVTRKVLRALMSQIENKPLARLEESNVGIEYFKAAYDSQRVRALVKPWSEYSRQKIVSLTPGTGVGQNVG